MNPPRRRWWLWCAILLVLISGWLLLRTPPGWYQPNRHASGAGERFEQLVVDQLTMLREQDQRWELPLDVASCNAFLAQRLRRHAALVEEGRRFPEEAAVEGDEVVGHEGGGVEGHVQ